MLASILLITSCTSYKKVPYIQQDKMSFTDPVLYDAKIMPKDILVITVNTTNPEAATPFNLTVQTALNTQNKSTYSQPALQQYLVDNDGDIDFPVLGTLHVGGMTKTQAEELIKSKLKPFLNEIPIVTVRMTNYKISVLGEVQRPGTFTINNEKVNIFEALAMAGDMTVYGVRDQVKLIREDEEGRKKVQILNMNDTSIINSPYYYLQQNDIVYVIPNKAKAKTSSISSSTTIWFSIVGTLVSLTSLIVTITK